MQMRAPLRRFFTAEAPEGGYPTGWAAPAARRMFWVALILRVLYITLAHTYRFRPIQDHFQFGWEMGRIARSLVTGFGYSDPFAGHTGPTAWTPPLYPLIMAAAFRLFGVYTAAAGWAILTFNSVFSAATAPAIFEIADRCYGPRPDGRRVALWSGWLWTLYPAAMQYAVHWPWDMALTTCLFAWALVFGLRLRGITGPTRSRSLFAWSSFGLLWGLIALSNSSLLLFLPFQTVWILWPFRRSLWPVLTRGIAALAIFLACLAPWILRNARAFHAFVPMRSNFGAELYEAALPSNEGFPGMATLPLSRDAPELLRYKRLGEIAYTSSQGRRAKAIIAANPRLFIEHVLLRLQFFWFSVPHPTDHGLFAELLREWDFAFLSLSGLFGLALSLRRRVPAAGIFAVAFAVLPALYYLITVQARFRAPLEPLIAIFSVYLFQNAERSRKRGQWNPSSSEPSHLAHGSSAR